MLKQQIVRRGTTRRLCRRIRLSAIVAAGIMPAIGLAESISWNNASGGSFADPANWIPYGPPGSADSAIFSAAGSYTVSFGGTYTNDRLNVDGGNVTFDLGSGTYSLLREADASGVSVHLSETAAASLTIVNGSILPKDASIGRVIGAPDLTAAMTIGAGGHWTAFEHFVATGETSSAVLTVENGGILEHGHGWAGGSSDVTGRVNVRGVGSDWFVTGWYGLGTVGRGELRVEQEGLARIGACEMAGNPGSHADAIVDGAGSKWQLLGNSEVCLKLGNAGSATVTLVNGGKMLSDGHVHLGLASGAAGRLKIDGTGSEASIARTLVIGAAAGGAGTIESVAGGKLVVNGRGAGDPNDHVGLEVGREGVGTLHIATGGTVHNEYITTIGGWPGGVGHAVVDGDGSWLENRYRLEVGRDGVGSLVIRNGGRVSINMENPDPDLSSRGLLVVGIRNAGQVLVTGGGSAPSTLDAAAQLQIGSGHAGTLIISGGAQVMSRKATSPTSSSGIIGRSAAFEGTVLIEGEGSLWTQDGGLNVGLDGRGVLKVENGGAVSCANGYIARLPGSVGTATIGGGASQSWWDMMGSLFIGGDASAAVAGSAGTLTIQSGGTVIVPVSTRVWGGGRINYLGGYFEAGSLELVGGGDVILAPAAGVVLSTTSLSIDASAGSQLDLADNAAYIDYTGASPVDSVRQLLQSGSAGGWSGDGITSSSAAADPTKGLGYGDGDGVLSILYAWKGDTNLNGQVDITDLGNLATHWQAPGIWADGDFNYDGFIDITDLGMFATNWQAGVAAPAGGSFNDAMMTLGLGQMTVPEPRMMAWLLAGFMLGRGNRRV